MYLLKTCMYTKMFICTQKCTYVHNNVHMYKIHACAQNMYVHNTCMYTKHTFTH